MKGAFVGFAQNIISVGVIASGDPFREYAKSLKTGAKETSKEALESVGLLSVEKESDHVASGAVKKESGVWPSYVPAAVTSNGLAITTWAAQTRTQKARMGIRFIA